MNYIQIEIGGKLRGWKVNQMTIEIWSKLMNNDAFGASTTYGAVYGGLIANCYVKQEEPDFTFENVCEWVDELQFNDAGRKVLESVKKVFEESQQYISVIDKLNVELDKIKKEADGVKKKVAPKKK